MTAKQAPAQNRPREAAAEEDMCAQPYGHVSPMAAWSPIDVIATGIFDCPVVGGDAAT
jgi:hypothetical protein